ncbi:hypothetical protein F4802DRAFT_603356 [Xylaria palmicola]|nr:hypothetical protein F4802DRAFT_603356 [Xylaria palmicola]
MSSSTMSSARKPKWALPQVQATPRLMQWVLSVLRPKGLSQGFYQLLNVKSPSLIDEAISGLATGEAERKAMIQLEKDVTDSILNWLYHYVAYDHKLLMISDEGSSVEDLFSTLLAPFTPLRKEHCPRKASGEQKRPTKFDRLRLFVTYIALEIAYIVPKLRRWRWNLVALFEAFIFAFALSSSLTFGWLVRVLVLVLNEIFVHGRNISTCSETK